MKQSEINEHTNSWEEIFCKTFKNEEDGKEFARVMTEFRYKQEIIGRELDDEEKIKRKELLQNFLDDGFVYIFRDDDLYLSIVKETKWVKDTLSGNWFVNPKLRRILTIEEDLFPDVAWKDKEPKRIENLLKKA